MCFCLVKNEMLAVVTKPGKGISFLAQTKTHYISTQQNVLFTKEWC